ncbi:MAG: imidazole glycerol phosphate synthase subunit HisH [Spirochaetaceae bacterium]|jgi:imidazole glycerol phosphate synthase glutamine amidotransferase subunit|nr:imidazole glycerol phosphate synthase subunit HisH [Spirochaetaceae bacterium]
MSGSGPVGIVDYGAGNIGSVMNALARLGADARLVRGPEELSGASPYEKIVFPGDGHFGTAMASLERAGYARALREWIAADRPFLGICIGLQILFQRSEEAPDTAGLGVIPGDVRRFPGPKVPQIGWNSTEARDSSCLFKGIPADSFFYYIHSYYASPADPCLTAAYTDYCLRYCAAVERGALSAVQFHPEKSGVWGLRLLENWLGGTDAG